MDEYICEMVVVYANGETATVTAEGNVFAIEIIRDAIERAGGNVSFLYPVA